ncbi:MAG: glycosyltransferase family 4 protein [Gemmatimonadaceae bacterium]
MLIALNLLYLIPGVVGGTETYATSLIHALAKVDGENDYVVFVNKGAADLEVTPGPNFHRVVCPFIALRRVVRYGWEQAVFPFQLRHRRPDLLHSLGYVSPLAGPGPQVVTVPDLNYIRHQGRHTAAGRRVLRFFVEQTVKRADHVITISEFSRDEIVRNLEIPEDKVTVTHLAGRDSLNGAGGDENVPAIPPPYIMAFSSLSAHKNLPRLVAAFHKIIDVVPHSLVLVGHMPENPEFRAELEGAIGDRVKFTGYVPDDQVESLMKNASLFAFPSLYEGFGLPILDAQHAGVPVTCSSVAALPEVAGDGAYLFDPLSVDEMADALKACLVDLDLRSSLIEKGFRNAARFSWDKTARETLAVYSAVAP